MDRILGTLGDRGDDAVNLVILDACRNNPFKKHGTRAIGDKGLARVSAPSGTLILYATKPGETASDNPKGRNGLFTKHLLQAMDKVGVQVEEGFKQVALNVYRESRKSQSPWQEGVIYGRFYFVPPPPQPPPVPAPAPDPEIMFWQSMDRCGSEACYRAYLEQYPNGRFSTAVRARIAQTQPPTPELIPLTVKTTPEGAQVRILNIGPKYQDGMELKPGRYRIEAAKSGYRKHLGWHELTTDASVYMAELEELPTEPPKPVYNKPSASRL